MDIGPEILKVLKSMRGPYAIFWCVNYFLGLNFLKFATFHGTWFVNSCFELMCYSFSLIELQGLEAILQKCNQIFVQAIQSTQGSLKPIFISVGHRISLTSAIKIVKLTCKYRVPEPIRQVTFYKFCIFWLLTKWKDSTFTFVS